MAKAQVVKEFLPNCTHTEYLVNSYIDGELSPYYKGMFREHLDECPECALMVKEMESLKDLSATLSEEPIPEDVSSRLRSKLKETFSL